MGECGVDISKSPTESELEYIWRIGNYRYLGILDITWDELAEILNKNLHEPEDYVGSSAYRKKYAVMRQAYDEIFSKDTGSSAQLQEIKEEKNNLYKERVKLSDERRELNALLRKQAREESFLDMVRNAFKHFDYVPIEPPESQGEKPKYGPDLLIPVTDVHTGELIQNAWNTYDNNIMRNRFYSYMTKIREIQKLHGAVNAYVVLSELVSGLIHTTTRIESNENVIDQFLNAMNQVMWFLLQLSAIFTSVHVYVAPGNHSRLFPNKEDNRKGENLDNLALHYLGGYLQNVDNVYFHHNHIDESIALFEMQDGITVASVHGDKDTPENVCRHITELTGVVPNICLLGHKHTNALITVNGGCKVIQSGAFSGIGNYSIDKRLQGRPEQAVAVVGNNGLECLYDIDLRGN